MNKSFKRTLLSSLIVPFVVGASSASAVVIEQWDYTVDNNFANVDFRDGDIDGPAGTTEVAGNNRMISWGGDPGDRSSVSITDVNSLTDGGLPKLVTNGGAEEVGLFTHNNNAISSSYDTLASFDLNATLTLTPYLPPDVGSAETLPTITFNTFFTETLNNPAGACADGSLTKPCGDLFTLGDVGALGTISGGTFQITPQTFTMAGVLYTVFLDLEDLDVLTADQCAAAGFVSGVCVGLLTPEDDLNTFKSFLTITAEEVPEPGTLALLGLGLTGLSLARRKKAAKA